MQILLPTYDSFSNKILEATCVKFFIYAKGEFRYKYVLAIPPSKYICHRV